MPLKFRLIFPKINPTGSGGMDPQIPMCMACVPPDSQRHGLYGRYNSKNHTPSRWQVYLILCSLRLLLRDETLRCLLDMPPKLLMDPQRGTLWLSPDARDFPYQIWI